MSFFVRTPWQPVVARVLSKRRLMALVQVMDVKRLVAGEESKEKSNEKSNEESNEESNEKSN